MGGGLVIFENFFVRGAKKLLVYRAVTGHLEGDPKFLGEEGGAEYFH